MYKCHDGLPISGYLFNADTNQPTTELKERLTPAMHQSNPSNPSSSRPTLKLKIAARKSAREIKTAPPPRPQTKLTQNPPSTSSHHLKHRMQEEMDAFISR